MEAHTQEQDKPKVLTNSARKYRAYPTVEQQATALSWSHTIRAVRNMVAAQDVVRFMKIGQTLNDRAKAIESI